MWRKLKINKSVFIVLLMLAAYVLIAKQTFAAKSAPVTKEPLSEILKRDYIGEIPKGSSQYDFFIGEWDVDVQTFKKDGSKDQSLKGIWYAKYLHDKRVLFDDVVFFGEEGKLYPGYPSLRTFSEKTGKWNSMHMAPLATQAMCRNIGEWKNNEMHIDSVCYKQDNTVQSYSRVRFYNITESNFDYTWEDSKNGTDWWLYVTFKGTRRAM